MYDRKNLYWIKEAVNYIDRLLTLPHPCVVSRTQKLEETFLVQFSLKSLYRATPDTETIIIIKSLKRLINLFVIYV